MNWNYVKEKKGSFLKKSCYIRILKREGSMTVAGEYVSCLYVPVLICLSTHMVLSIFCDELNIFYRLKLSAVSLVLNVWVRCFYGIWGGCLSPHMLLNATYPEKNYMAVCTSIRNYLSSSVKEISAYSVYHLNTLVQSNFQAIWSDCFSTHMIL